MTKFLIAFGLVAATVTAVTAADDPVAARKALMQSVGAAAGTSGAMLKGDLDYNPAVGKSAIAAINATAMVYGDYFPEGSDMAADTTASPKIWEDRAGFDAEIAKLKEAVSAATAASGKDGPADLEAFKTAMTPVLGTCKGCHEGYRVKK